MEMQFIGSGSAFVNRKINYQSNVLLKKDGQNLLIDCGSDARHALDDLGYGPNDIHDLFITHYHADHIGSLEWLAFCTFFNPSAPKPRLYLSTREFADGLWDAIKPGLSSIEFEKPSLEMFFEVLCVGDSFYWADEHFELIQTVHTLNNNIYNLSYGLSFDLNGKRVWFSGDTQFAPNQYIKLLNGADIIFHDCETSPFESTVHSHYKHLITLDPEIKKKMWLYHHNEKPFDAEAEGFAGFVERGQTFE